MVTPSVFLSTDSLLNPVLANEQRKTTESLSMIIQRIEKWKSMQKASQFRDLAIINPGSHSRFLDDFGVLE